ncbi:phage replisome organizer N-terminal domain-containing protein [Bacillus sonorensis]|uniref:phage replisome organizer N-terminal domain-containing protein n=1 Tax=Bacillus sonorensis TaxID=119858 RepID=UPI002280FD5E|nr:phage replisome organizer N-terminal domain-containing protein [Bacillus sonorensis]MCY8025696.1 phage replisome organizer N-terminal domain-containing protein [Bacillus sonorensis]MCY8087636.1 phage replisome organizer N-terminal domain-containing protein [Bacillus sonorensis]MCY8271414.1 phage replisome organizer N-terminal domain-containing protein [Bacillus sonorensis]MCY8603950.1 phage replisome organizer N-terminal domain-containing protein [Bacillus sonorensis]
MAEVKWIKLSTQMFEDEKIKLIEQMPEADTILIIWVKLLAQAGKTNASGYIYLSQNIPYTDEMLATIFNRPLPIVRMALQTFQRFGMIEVDENRFISITNWEKHQNIDAMDKIREDTRKRVAKYRAKQKALKLSAPSNVTCNVTVTESNETEEEKEEEREEENNILSGKPDDAASKKDTDEIPYKLIIDLLNKVAGTKYRPTTPKTKTLIKARWNEGFRFDDFKHVILVKCEEWRGTDLDKYLRPETLFGTKFENYLNQKPKGGRPHDRNIHQRPGGKSQGRVITEDDIPY